MATTVLGLAPAAVAPPALAPELYRLSAAQYHRMIDCGIVPEGERVELIDGRLVSKMAPHPPHIFAVDSLTEAFMRGLPAGSVCRCQQPVSLGESEPQPDVAVVAGNRADYARRLPTAADIVLVVEVSDSSLDFDRGEKARVYAAAGLPLYWVVNLIDGQVEVYTMPGPGGYAERRDYLPGAVLALPLGALTMGVEVAACLPAAV